MARRPNYAFERNERAKKKAAKREAKRAAKNEKSPTGDDSGQPADVGADSPGLPVSDLPEDGGDGPSDI